MFLPQLDSIVKTNSPLPIIFIMETRRIKLSRNRKNSEAYIRRFAFTSLRTRGGLRTHSELNLAAFRYFWRAEPPRSVLRPLRPLHQHLAATAAAFIGRWGGRKWHHPGLIIAIIPDHTSLVVRACTGLEHLVLMLQPHRKWWLLFIVHV